MRTALAIAAVALVAAACSTDTVAPPQLADVPGAELPSGERAPDFTVVTFDGATFSLSEHLANDGRPVFLNLWASWCAPCRAEMPDLDAAATANPGVAFIGVAVQDVEGKSQDFADEIGVGYPLAFDEDREVDNAYAPIGLPASYIISTDGILVERIFGPLTGAQIEEKLEAHFGGQ
jgi:thiol-disulfide isomerase/thioredoxin